MEGMEGMEGLERALQEDLEDWALVTRFLPEDWERMARVTRALRRTKKFADADSLLRTLLIHLATGCSLMETAARARRGGVAQVSGVAVWKRLREAGEWFRWMAQALMAQWVERLPRAVLPGTYRLRLVDASMVSEPGSTGSDWRLHYAVELGTLQCDFVEVTDVKAGESFRRFPVQAGDLLIGDRAYANPPGVAHVVRNEGDVLVRMTRTNLPLETPEGRAFSLVKRLKRLDRTELGDWACRVKSDRPDEGFIVGRVCAIRKSRTAAERARAEVLREAKKDKRTAHPDTLTLASYVVIFTTVPAPRLSASATLEVYRGRWQIELVFKRLKSLLALGHLPKKDPQGAKAWLLGKLLVAFLVEAFIHAGEAFSPWGYPLGAPRPEGR